MSDSCPSHTPSLMWEPVVRKNVSPVFPLTYDRCTTDRMDCLMSICRQSQGKVVMDAGVIQLCKLTALHAPRRSHWLGILCAVSWLENIGKWFIVSKDHCWTVTTLVGSIFPLFLLHCPLPIFSVGWAVPQAETGPCEEPAVLSLTPLWPQSLCSPSEGCLAVTLLLLLKFVL